jgi:hypothetical protein
MLRVKVKRIRDGLHPNEVVVGFDTPDGTQETLVVDRRSLRSDDTLRVGYPVGSDQANRRLLVELPRETMRGQWRVWVSADSVVKEDEAA